MPTLTLGSLRQRAHGQIPPLNGREQTVSLEYFSYLIITVTAKKFYLREDENLQLNDLMRYLVKASENLQSRNGMKGIRQLSSLKPRREVFVNFWAVPKVWEREIEGNDLGIVSSQGVKRNRVYLTAEAIT